MRLIKKYIIFFYNIIYSVVFRLQNGSSNLFECKGNIIGVEIKVKGSNNKIIIEEGASLHKSTILSIRGNNNLIHIKHDSLMNEGGLVRIEGNSNRFIVGENSSLISVFFSMGDDHTDIEIGSNCLFSANVIFRNWDNHSIVIAKTPNVRICEGKNIKVEDHVWIGYGATVMKGVSIGHDSIIGTMSVVTSDVPSHSIVAGNPARVVKSGISWNKEWLKFSV